MTRRALPSQFQQQEQDDHTNSHRSQTSVLEPPTTTLSRYQATHKDDNDIEVKPANITNENNDDSDNDDTENDGGGKHLQVIHTDLLIYGPASKSPSKDQSIVLKRNLIHWLGPTSTLPHKYHSLPSTTVPCLLPGFWDAHVHLLGVTTFDFKLIPFTPDVAKGFLLARSCLDLINAGFTSVRCLGGSGPELAAVIDPQSTSNTPGLGLTGPKIYGAGSALSQTSGHGDIFDLPYGIAALSLGVPSTTSPLINSFAPGSAGLCLADGVPECIKAVRLQIRRGARVIKIFATGGVLSIRDDPQLAQFNEAELEAIVGEATRHGRIVAAHAHGKAGIMAALRAGVGSIEHGTYMDDECIELMKKRGVVYVPTRTVVVEGLKHPELMSPESYAKLKVVAKVHREAYRLAVKAGLKIVLGTDCSISTPGLGVSLGMGGREFELAVQDGGMGELEAIEAGTANGKACLGKWDWVEGMKTGVIREGYEADLVGLKQSPLGGNMGVMGRAEMVGWVWKGGSLFKGQRGNGGEKRPVMVVGIRSRVKEQGL